MTANSERVIGAAASSAGRFTRVVDKLIIYGAPLDFRALCEHLITVETRYLVLDLDRTLHLGRNMGELLGWELVAYRAYGPERYRELGERRGPGRFVFDWSRPGRIAAYLGRGARVWAWPGLAYLAAIKIGHRSELATRWLHRRLGIHPVQAVQTIPRNALLHELSDLPASTLRELARAVWQRHAGDQVITRGDIDWLRARFPQLKILISSASPQIVLEVAGEEMGADGIFFTSIEQRDGYYSSPLALGRLFMRFRLPRRISPPSQQRHNAGATKIEGVLERYPDFCEPGVQTVGVTDTSYGEDHAWAQYFTKVADINSPTPFAPIVAASSPLREIHSAQVLTQLEIERATTDPTWLDPRRSPRPDFSSVRYGFEELSSILDPVLRNVEDVATSYHAEAGVVRSAIQALEVRAKELQTRIEGAVAQYNASAGLARRRAYRGLRDQVREDARLRRSVARQRRRLSELSHRIARLLEGTRAALEQPGAARELIQSLSDRHERAAGLHDA